MEGVLSKMMMMMIMIVMMLMNLIMRMMLLMVMMPGKIIVARVSRFGSHPFTLIVTSQSWWYGYRGTCVNQHWGMMSDDELMGRDDWSYNLLWSHLVKSMFCCIMSFHVLDQMRALLARHRHACQLRQRDGHQDRLAGDGALDRPLVHLGEGMWDMGTYDMNKQKMIHVARKFDASLTHPKLLVCFLLFIWFIFVLILLFSFVLHCTSLCLASCICSTSCSFENVKLSYYSLSLHIFFLFSSPFYPFPLFRFDPFCSGTSLWTRSLGPWKLPCYIRFLIISG